MRFIKKLVIMTGGYSKGTLMLEKNSFGVWGRLNLFDYRIKDGDRLVVFSGGNLFVMRLSAEMLDSSFELGELDLDAVHAAIVGDGVALYGSNCALKLRPSFIMDKVRSEERRLIDNEKKFVKFSGRECEYFHSIAPPPYNDFAIADKNYFPAYLSAVSEEEDEGAISINVGENSKVEKETEKLMPHQLEQKYLRLMQVAATIIDKNDSEIKNAAESGENEDSIVNITDTDPPKSEKELIKEEVRIDGSDEKSEVRVGKSDEKSEVRIGKSDEKSEVRIKSDEKSEVRVKSDAEKPEVIAVAKKAVLSDLKEEQPIRGRKATYFERSSEQLGKLLAGNERFAPIERLIPGSKFVKINYDGQRYYLVGVIGSDYICYGVPAMFSETPPKPLTGYARWLPCNASDPHGEGFWMMYQDGVSGETLKS